MTNLPIDIVREISQFDHQLECALFPSIQPRPTKSLVEYCVTLDFYTIFKNIFKQIEYTKEEAHKLLELVVKSTTTLNLNFVKDIFTRYPYTEVLTNTLNYVLYDGHVELIKWMVDNGAKVTNDVFSTTIYIGSIDLMTFFLNIDYIDPTVNDNHAFWLAFDRRDEVMTWLLYSDYRINVCMSRTHLREVFAVA
ncbi:hypothetical protein OAV62_01215 [bacterium]|nr:hypothetical protein [bacterium]